MTDIEQKVRELAKRCVTLVKVRQSTNGYTWITLSPLGSPQMLSGSWFMAYRELCDYARSKGIPVPVEED